MLKTADQLDAEIKILDNDIAGRERRLSMVRRRREKLYLERAALDTPPADKFEQRAGARLEKARGKCVTVNGWDV